MQNLQIICSLSFGDWPRRAFSLQISPNLGPIGLPAKYPSAVLKAQIPGHFCSESKA